MKKLFYFISLSMFLLWSCKDDNATKQNQIQKTAKQRELLFNSINNHWNFTSRNLTPESQTIANNWNDWRLFISELNQKPKGTLRAFQLKTKSLVQKTENLNNNIPEKINKPQVKSRLVAVITKVKALNIFLNLEKIPEKKVIQLITDLNVEVNGIYDQIEETVSRGNIKIEEGEAEMLNGYSNTTVVNPSGYAN